MPSSHFQAIRHVLQCLFDGLRSLRASLLNVQLMSISHLRSRTSHKANRRKTVGLKLLPILTRTAISSCSTMLRRVGVLCVSVGFLLLTSCASMSEEECLYTNWHARGVMDGDKGIPASRVNRYQDNCSKYAVSVDQTAYEEGRREGVERYCKKDNGFAVGMRGDEYEGACTVDNERLFLSGYQPGRLMYSALENVRNAEASVSNATYQIQGNESRIDRLYKDLDNSEHTQEKRDDIRKQIRSLRRENEVARDRRRSNEMRIPELHRRCVETKQRVEALGFVVSDYCY